MADNFVMLATTFLTRLPGTHHLLTESKKFVCITVDTITNKTIPKAARL